MVSLFLLLGCNLSYIVDLFAGLRELTSASMRTLLKLASSVRALLKPYGATLSHIVREPENIFRKGNRYPLHQRRYSGRQDEGYRGSVKCEEG